MSEALLDRAIDPTAIAQLAARFAEYTRDRRAHATKRAYATAWRRFGEWCQTQGATGGPLAAPPQRCGGSFTIRADPHPRTRPCTRGRTPGPASCRLGQFGEKLVAPGERPLHAVRARRMGMAFDRTRLARA